jgi:hypothetical protein
VMWALCRNPSGWRPIGEQKRLQAFATKGRKFAFIASLTTINIHFPRQHEPRRARYGSPGGARAPRMPSTRQSTGTSRAARACAPERHCRQPQTLRRGFATTVTSAQSARRGLQPCPDGPQHQQARTECRARALGARHSSTARGGSCIEASRKPEVELGGHNWPRNSRAAHGSPSPAPLVRLVVQVDRHMCRCRTWPSARQRQKHRTCASQWAISGREGQCRGQKGFSRALEQEFSAGARRGLPGLSDAAAVAKRGAKPSPEPSAAKGLLCVFCLGCSTY